VGAAGITESLSLTTRDFSSGCCTPHGGKFWHASTPLLAMRIILQTSKMAQ
jgi:hypothetical protein